MLLPWVFVLLRLSINLSNIQKSKYNLLCKETLIRVDLYNGSEIFRAGQY